MIDFGLPSVWHARPTVSFGDSYYNVMHETVFPYQPEGRKTQSIWGSFFTGAHPQLQLQLNNDFVLIIVRFSISPRTLRYWLWDV